MKTYFIAGHSTFADGSTWHFHRLVNWTEKDTPRQFMESMLEELENSKENNRFLPFAPNYCSNDRGKIILTAFNQV